MPDIVERIARRLDRAMGYARITNILNTMLPRLSEKSQSAIGRQLERLSRYSGRSISELLGGSPFRIDRQVTEDALITFRSVVEQDAIDGLQRDLDEIEKTIKMVQSYRRIEPRVIEAEQSGVSFRFILYHRESEIWFGRKYRDGNLMRSRPLIRPDDIVFDFGSNAGYHSVWMAICAPLGHVHAFDPFPWNTASVRAQAKLNGLGNITAYCVGVGKSDRVLQVKTNSAKTFNPDRRGRTLPIIVRDVRNYRHLNPTFLKIDIEGAEHELAETDLLSWPSIRCGYVEMHPEFIKEAGGDPAVFVRQAAAEGYALTDTDVPVEPPIDVLLGKNYFFRRMPAAASASSTQ